jgi:hypothetical protein
LPNATTAKPAKVPSFSRSVAGFTQADVGAPVYFSDDNTVTKTPGTNTFAGLVRSVDSATSILVDLRAGYLTTVVVPQAAPAALGVLEPWLQVQDELGTSAFSDSVGFDGVSFFYDSHVWEGMSGAGGANQSNITDDYLSAAAVYGGIKAMSTFVGPDGIPLLVQPTHFCYAPALEQTVDQLFNAPLGLSQADPGGDRFHGAKAWSEPLKFTGKQMKAF